MSAPTVYIILPAFNEAVILPRLIPDIAKTLSSQSIPFQIGLVDDGSTDDTLKTTDALAATLPVHVSRHPKNRGYGAALKTGVLWAIDRAQPNDIVITLDADNTHLPMYILVLIEKIHQGFDVVTASYEMPGGKALGVPFQRRCFSFGANRLFRIFFRIPGVQTYTNGFRAYRAAALQQVHRRYGDSIIEETGFPGGTELFIKVCRTNGIRAAEIPFVLHYENRGNQSRIHITSTIARYLRLIARCSREKGLRKPPPT